MNNPAQTPLCYTAGANLLIGIFLTATISFLYTASSLHAQNPLYGSTGAHDPSTLIKDGGTYYTFTTGQDIPCLKSTDLRNWTTGPSVFPGGPPAWTTTAVAGFTGFFWAPDIAYFNGRYHLYYSCSSWGTIDSAIGVVTSPSLDYPVWTDQGKVVQSDAIWEETPDTDYTYLNCIDPSVWVEANGRVWLTFGSYSSGIVIREINPTTGKPLNSTTTLLANNAGGGWGSSVEGAFVYKNGGYSYLFVNYGGCCSGIDSTYNIRVGRSTSPTGPYFDKAGVNMIDAGGTMLLESSRRFVGPGHPGILNDNGTFRFTYHYYDALSNGAPTLAVQELIWGDGGWPQLTGDWSAQYTFNVSAREHSGLYNGSLANGASIVAEAGRGGVLDLNGTTQHVTVPNSMANAKTFAAWVKWKGGPAYQRIFDFGNDTSHYMFLTPAADNGKTRFAICNGGAEQRFDAPSALPVDTWCHVAVTLDSTGAVLYLDGSPVATSADIKIRPWELLARNCYIGRSHFIADPYFDGRIDSLRIFGRALTAAEIADIAIAPSSLSHRYSFSNDARDSIGMANGGLKGNAAISNGALQLSGNAGDYVNLPGGLITGSSAVSIEAWAHFGTNADWARLFDFGDTDGTFGSNFLFWTPRASTGMARFNTSTTGGGTFIVESTTLNNTSAHLVFIVDPPGNYAAVYVNGSLQAQTNSGVAGLNRVSRAWAFLGRSLFSADAWLNASIDEFRIYDARLTPEEISANHYTGPNVINSALVWTGSPTQLWQHANFGTDWNTPAISGDEVDGDMDGLPNLLEYALGTNPNVSGTSGLPQSSTNGGKLKITFTRNTAASDLKISVMAADDLASAWTEIARSTNGAAFTATAPGAFVSEFGGSVKDVEATDIHLTNDPAHPKRFMRLEVKR